jgi:hypothetical protein
MTTVTRRAISILMFIVAPTAAWTSAGCDLVPEPTPRGGVLATFEVGGEQFRVFVTNPSAIGQLFALQSGQSFANIPNGKIRRGAGVGRHNAPYTWHLDPEEIELAALTTEVCDGRPSYVQDNVGEYVDVVGRYCPWGAKLIALEDRR